MRAAVQVGRSQTTENLPGDLRLIIARGKRRESRATPGKRSRGDLIEVWKAKASQGLSQLAGVLNFSGSGVNLICKPGKSKSSKFNRIKRNFINERVMLFWNKLPIEVKNAPTLNSFKANLELFKSKTKAFGIYGSGNFWELSDEVLNRIESGNYLENKLRHNSFLQDNPFVAKKKFINIY